MKEAEKLTRLKKALDGMRKITEAEKLAQLKNIMGKMMITLYCQSY